MTLSKLYDDKERTIVQALKEGHVLRLWYGDPMTLRDVEVHALGMSRAGNMCVRVYQVTGDVGWKLLALDRLELAEDPILPEPSMAPRPGYRQGDSQMAVVYEEYVP